MLFSCASSLAFLYERKVELLEGDFQFLARLELDDCAFGDDDIVVGLCGVSAHARLANLNFENAEVSKFQILALRERFRQDVERALDDVFDIVLEIVASAAFLFFLINSLYDFSLSEVLHNLLCLVEIFLKIRTPETVNTVCGRTVDFNQGGIAYLAYANVNKKYG